MLLTVLAALLSYLILVYVWRKRRKALQAVAAQRRRSRR